MSESFSIAEHPSITDQSFLINLYNLNLKIIEQEYEIAILKAFNTLFDQQLFLDQIAVERAEEWIQDIKDKLPSLERVVLEEEKKMDHYTGLLTDVIIQTQEVCSKEDEKTHVEQNSFTNQIPTAALENSPTLQNESKGSREHSRERGEEIQDELMGGEALMITIEYRTETAKRSKKKKTCGCFSCLWRCRR